MKSHRSFDNWNLVREKFQNIWGYSDFRYPQAEIVRSLLQHRDTLVVLPTGGGKSICFQLPALLQTGLTLVVSPLVALMENQVRELRDRRLPAATLHGEIPRHQSQKTLQDLRQNRLRLLYLSPETLLTPKLWDVLSSPQIPINGLILDEAHCLAQWGDIFRPEYRRLGAVREALLKSKPQPHLPIAAFTATANPSARKTICTTLNLKSPQVFLENPYRPNLALHVKIAWTPRGRKQQVLELIRSHPRQSGLVYARTRRDGEALAQWLGDRGYPTAAYHAGLSPNERRSIEARWMANQLPFVVCTSAFGMGVNKPDVRWVVQFQAPAQLSEYVQEVGRAGRDGKEAVALTLVSEPTGFLDGEDKQRRKFLQNRERSQRQRAQKLAKKLPRQGDVRAVTNQFRDGAVALSILHGLGRLEWIDPFNYRILSASQDTATEFRSAGEIVRYLNTHDCRWKFILEAFGFQEQASSMQCGKCDRCVRRR